MPYEYRKLSPEEREEVVRYRRQHGYPLHAPPHPFREAGHYLITAANYEHQPIMDSPARRTEFEVCLLEEIKSIQASFVAWSILPNHYHILIDTDSLDSIAAALKHLHGTTSRKWNLEDSLTEKRRVWYKFYDRFIRNERQLLQAFNYIHHNPVKHGYTDDVYNWYWSSCKLYEENNGRDWLREQWKANIPSDDFGKGWDE